MSPFLALGNVFMQCDSTRNRTILDTWRRHLAVLVLGAGVLGCLAILGVRLMQRSVAEMEILLYRDQKQDGEWRLACFVSPDHLARLQMDETQFSQAIWPLIERRLVLVMLMKSVARKFPSSTANSDGTDTSNVDQWVLPDDRALAGRLIPSSGLRLEGRCRRGTEESKAVGMLKQDGTLIEVGR